MILGRVYEVQGDFESAIALYERAHAIDDSAAESLGDRDRALAALQAAIDERSWFVTWLRVDPLREDPRFASLVKV